MVSDKWPVWSSFIFRNVILPVNNTISNQMTNSITIVSTSEDIL